MQKAVKTYYSLYFFFISEVISPTKSSPSSTLLKGAHGSKQKLARKHKLKGLLYRDNPAINQFCIRQTALTQGFFSRKANAVKCTLYMSETHVL